MAWQVYWMVSVLVYHQAREGCDGAPTPAPAAEPGAERSFVALEQGAQRTFDLFYPQLPETTPTTIEVRTVHIYLF